MADMHILNGDGKKWRIVMHFPVPTDNNSVGVSWSDALVAWAKLNDANNLPPQSILNPSTTGDATTAGPGEISDNEKAEVAAGAVYEHQGMFLVESNGTPPAQLRVAIRKFYQKEKSDLTAQIGVRLRYFGHQEAGA